MADAAAGAGPVAMIDHVGRSIDDALGGLRAVGSAARYGDQLAAVIVDAHAEGFRRLIALASDSQVLAADPDLAELLWVHEAAGDGAAVANLPARIDAMRASIEQTGVPGLLDAADRLIESTMELYGWALDHSIGLLHDAGDADALHAALEDPLVSALLLGHGLHPAPLSERIRHVLAACAETLGDHAGVVELLEASDGDGHVRLSISGGDEKQRWRTRLTVERAIRELVADVVTLDVEGAEAEPRGTPGPTIIPVTSIGRRRTSRWLEIPGAAALGDGEALQVAADGVALVACRVGNDWFVARDPFTSNTVRLVATDPPTVEAGDGTRHVFVESLATHVDGGVVEVLL